MALISRKDLVNLNNMPALSEDVCTPDMAGSDSWLSRKVASFTDPAEWKITRFGTTPAVSSIFLRFPSITIQDAHVALCRCHRTLLRLRLARSSTSTAHTRVLSVGVSARFGCIVRRAFQIFLVIHCLIFLNEAARGGTKQGQYPLDYMAACMPEYESMFHIEYPLPKLDILAVS